MKLPGGAGLGGVRGTDRNFGSRAPQSRAPLKTATLSQPAKTSGGAPPVYRSHNAKISSPAQVTAPPVYNPYQSPPAVQPKTGFVALPKNRMVITQPVSRPAPKPVRGPMKNLASTKTAPAKWIQQTPRFPQPVPEKQRLAGPGTAPAIQRRVMSTAASGKSPSPRFLPSSRSTIQLKPNVPQLQQYCGDVEDKEGFGLLQVQAMSIGKAVVISANRGDLHGAVSDGAGKETKVGKDTLTIKSAADAAAAAGKIDTGGIIVLAPDSDLHAEQNLLLALAYYMQTHSTPGNVAIAGRAEPCDSCKTVLYAFQTCYTAASFGKFKFSGGQGQGRSVAKLNLNTKFPNPPEGAFKNFIDAYSRRVS